MNMSEILNEQSDGKNYSIYGSKVIVLENDKSKIWINVEIGSSEFATNEKEEDPLEEMLN